MKKGYITVFFTITLALCISMFAGLMYGLRENAIRMKAKCAIGAGMESIYGEYNKALWDRFGLLFVDSSFQTQVSSMVLEQEHLRDTINKNFDEEIPYLWTAKDLLKIRCTDITPIRVRLASDNNGKEIFRQGSEYMKTRTKLTYMEELMSLVDSYNVFQLGDTSIVKQTKEALDEVGDTSEAYDFDGWLTFAKAKEDSQGHLKILSPLRGIADESSISLLQFDSSAYAGERALNTGNWDSTYEEGVVDWFLFREYLCEKCSFYGNKKDGSLLDYQLEYLLGGKDSDVSNLETIVNRILLIREAANVITLYRDESKMSVIKTVVETIMTILMVPELSEAVSFLIVAGWSWIESRTDLKTLLAGGKVALVKAPEEWKTDLSSAMNNLLGKDNSEENGLSYKDYLRLFLVFSDTDTLCLRFMSVIEQDIRLTDKNEFFRLDNCFDACEYEISIVSDYGFSYIARREMNYYSP